VSQLTPDLTVPEAVRLLSKLEHAPELIVSHWGTLEQLIASCMERTFQAAEVGKKQLLASIEYRARLLK
jgi:hypothetical protein